MKSALHAGKSVLGVLLKDLWRYHRALSSEGQEYLALCNRYERLVAGPGGSGYRCDWRWTSQLHAPSVMPSLGLRLMERALRDHPIRRASTPAHACDGPEISFIIGHRGTEREPLLMATIASIAAQEGVTVECIVVEQDVEPRLAGRLPDWVTLVQTAPPTPQTPYNRSWAFNIGADSARGGILVLHDNDMLVPVDYAREIVGRVRQGYEVVNLKRFIFYLTEEHTREVLAARAEYADASAQAIVQNLEAGGSVAITGDAFDQIGGMDESFVGWGGEDNEFWERAQTRRVWPYGYLPIVHLWHAPQPEKRGLGMQSGPARYGQLRALPVAERIDRLKGLS